MESEIIGRKEEMKTLCQCLASKQPEFLVVYGRRRVGKTFLIKQFFSNQFAFYATGAKSNKARDKLALFQASLERYGHKKRSVPKNWIEAFTRLRELLEDKDCYRDPSTGKKVVFLDELPWMDSPRSDFKLALDFFWNGFASTQPDILFIVCGSATSWIINNISKDTGGFYNRVTNQIHLLPFHLKECAELARRKGLDYDEATLARAYMVFGGIPFYWSMLWPSESLDQSIDRLCFKEGGALRYEFQNLFSSLFTANGGHREIIEALSKKTSGLTRNELIEKGIPGGKSLTKALEELRQCGFVREFAKPGKINGAFYQIIDPFTRFAIGFILKDKTSAWKIYANSPSYYAWQGNAFELLCLIHINEIKEALGIADVESREYSFRSKNSDHGAQIDLVIERKDGVSNLCEMKFTKEPFVIDEGYASDLEAKLEAFHQESKGKSTLRIALISASGLAQNKYSSIVKNVVTLKDFLN